MGNCGSLCWGEQGVGRFVLAFGARDDLSLGSQPARAVASPHPTTRGRGSAAPAPEREEAVDGSRVLQGSLPKCQRKPGQACRFLFIPLAFLTPWGFTPDPGAWITLPPPLAHCPPGPHLLFLPGGKLLHVLVPIFWAGLCPPWCLSDLMYNGH